MAFCRYCGRELQEGEVCSCRDQGETPKTEVADAVSIQGKQIAGEAWKDFIRLLKSPASYAGSYVKSGNMVTAILFLVLQAICSSIFAVLCIGKINGLIGLGGSMTESLKFSSVGAFFLTLLYSILLSVALTALYLGGSKLLRGELSIRQALSAVSVRSVILVPVKLAGCLLFSENRGDVCAVGAAGLCSFIAQALLQEWDFWVRGARGSTDSAWTVGHILLLPSLLRLPWYLFCLHFGFFPPIFLPRFANSFLGRTSSIPLLHSKARLGEQRLKNAGPPCGPAFL